MAENTALQQGLPSNRFCCINLTKSRKYYIIKVKSSSVGVAVQKEEDTK